MQNQVRSQFSLKDKLIKSVWWALYLVDTVWEAEWLKDNYLIVYSNLLRQVEEELCTTKCLVVIIILAKKVNKNGLCFLCSLQKARLFWKKQAKKNYSVIMFHDIRWNQAASDLKHCRPQFYMLTFGITILAPFSSGHFVIPTTLLNHSDDTCEQKLINFKVTYLCIRCLVPFFFLSLSLLLRFIN